MTGAGRRRVGVIRVLTTDDPDLLNAHGRVLASRYGFDVVSRCIPDQEHGVHDDESFALAAPKVVELASALESEVDALVLSCAADPGLAAAREAVSIPVFGAGSSAAERALTLGSRVGVLDLTVRTPAAVRDTLGDAYVDALVPAGVTESRHLLTGAGRAAALDGARILVERGADVVLLACTGMTTIGLADSLATEIEVPIVDAVLAAGAAAAHALGAP